MPDSRNKHFVNESTLVSSAMSQEHFFAKENKTFTWLWIGQLVSNLGTQTSLYGIGLWLFSQTQNLFDFALVAFAVQLARILVLPLLSNRLGLWPRRRVMLIANGIGAFCTLALATLLLPKNGMPPLSTLLFVQGFAAMAEATLILSFSTLIPLLIVQRKELIRANGLFATTDSLVLTMAPFLGSWLSGLLGLTGILVLDGCSFFLALFCVLAAPWPSRFVGSSEGFQQWEGFDLIQGWKRVSSLWGMSPLARVSLVISTAIAFSYAATEVLFPAWVAVAYGTKQMAYVLVVAAVGYLIGFLAWRQKIGLYWQRAWFLVVLIQALILMGAGLQFFADRPFIWFTGVLLFSAGLPIVMSSIQQSWSQLATPKELPRLFALRYTFEWSARLIAFLTVSIAVDRILTPALNGSYLPSWIQISLGVGEGRPIAIAIGAIGWIMVIALWSQLYNLKSSHSRSI